MPKASPGSRQTGGAAGLTQAEAGNSEPGSGTTRKGRPRDPRFAAQYEAVRKVWPEIATERGRYLKARALFVFDVLRRVAPELLAWFCSGHLMKTKALAALARFDEESIVVVAREIVADDMPVLHAVAFCDRVVQLVTAPPEAT